MTKINAYNDIAALRQQELLHGEMKPHRFVEKPMMKNLLPDLSGKRVLLVGCGTGEESSLLEECGVGKIVGIDLSEKSIALARKMYPRHDFIVCDMHSLAFKDATFDFVYSSLSIHYSKEPEKVYGEIYRVLKDGGRLLCSLAHPVRWASEQIVVDDIPVKAIGFSNDKNNKKLIGSYSTFAQHKHNFSRYGTLSFYVGPPSYHFRLLKEARFSIEDFVESQAIEECKEYDIYYYERYKEFPQFMAFLARKK